MSAFGGIIATNRTVTAAMAREVKEVFTEVIVAPGFEDEALSILKGKKNIRILRLPTEDALRTASMETRPISGGLLMQGVDRVDAEVRDETGAVTGGDRRTPGGSSPVPQPTRRRWRTCSSRGARSVR